MFVNLKINMAEVMNIVNVMDIYIMGFSSFG